MLGTIVSIVIAILVWWTAEDKGLAFSPGALGLAFLGISFLFPVLGTILNAMAWSPLQKVEQNLTPRLFELYSVDTEIHLLTRWLYLFPLFSLILTADLLFSKQIPAYLLIGLWTVLLGVSTDALFQLNKRTSSYLNPFTILTHFTKKAKEAVDKDNDTDLCNWIEALSEVSVKAIYRTLPSLACQAIDELQKVTRNFLVSEKSITHHMEDNAVESGGPDPVSFTLFYMFQRMELINDKALDHKLEPVCSRLITALGKIAVDAAKFDLSLSTYPLHYIGKFALKAQENRMVEVPEKAICTLLEVSKIILTEIDVKYQDLKDPFFSIIGHLENIAKESFRQNKDTNIKLLTQPFRDLKTMFENEKVASHQDTPAIVADLNRVLGEFAELELVLRTIPPIPKMEEASQG